MINKHCGHRRTVGGCADCRIAELEVEVEQLRYERAQAGKRAMRAESALHNITNMAHPQHMAIFNEAMKGLGLQEKAEVERLQEAAQAVVDDKGCALNLEGYDVFEALKAALKDDEEDDD